jgi:biotin synthase
MLEVKNFSSEFFDLLKQSNALSRQIYGSKGYIFAQIGINSDKCSGNCKFCSLAKDHFAVDTAFVKSDEDILSQSKELLSMNIDDLFLMTTADYPLDMFLSVGRKVAAVLPHGKRLVANIGDFGADFARELKTAGFTGAYHIKRLNEGVDTDISPETRLATIHAIKDAGLELYYCIEPIGPEHTYEQIADEIILSKELQVEAMAVMRRIAVPGTPLYPRGQISAAELVKIAAVTRIASMPSRSMNVHEPTEMSMLAGINQLYAEVGANPRDTNTDTAKGRGFSVNDVRKILQNGEWSV